MIRPQFGSPPHQLVFTSTELHTARQATSASASFAAPLTSTVTTRLVPSPSRTIIRAKANATSLTAAWNTAIDLASSVLFPAMPLASRITVSLVLMSPSTLIRLNDWFTAVARHCFSCRGAITASVVKNPSIVAMFGWIIPAPLAMPPIVIRLPPRVTRTAYSFEQESLVMIASAAGAPPLAEIMPSSFLMPAWILTLGRRTPMRPVEQTNTSSSSQPIRRATPAAIARAWIIPIGPVQALALPLLTMMARARSWFTWRML